MQTENDEYLMNQLPETLRNRLYTQFVFHDFLFAFRRYFRFRKEYNVFMNLPKISSASVSSSDEDNSPATTKERPEYLRFT